MMGKAIFLTGANGGMGSLLVPQLLNKGWTVFAGVTSGAANLGPHPRLHILQIDLTSEESITRAVQHVARSRGNRGLQAVLNLAGIIVEGPAEIVPESEFRRLYEINVFGPYAIIQQCLPLIRAGKGRIVNVAALSALISAPIYGLTASSKAALAYLTDGLRMELAPWHIPVVCIFPGATRTAVFATAEHAYAKSMSKVPEEKQALYRTMMAGFYAARKKQRESDPAVPVKAILKAIEAQKPKPYYLAGAGVKMAWYARYFPVRARDKSTIKMMGTA